MLMMYLQNSNYSFFFSIFFLVFEHICCCQTLSKKKTWNFNSQIDKLRLLLNLIGLYFISPLFSWYNFFCILYPYHFVQLFILIMPRWNPFSKKKKKAEENESTLTTHTEEVKDNTSSSKVKNNTSSSKVRNAKKLFFLSDYFFVERPERDEATKERLKALKAMKGNKALSEYPFSRTFFLWQIFFFCFSVKPLEEEPSTQPALIRKILFKLVQEILINSEVVLCFLLVGGRQ